MGKFFKDLKKGLEELIEDKQGKIKLRTTQVEICDSQVKNIDIKKFKKKKKSKNKLFEALKEGLEEIIKHQKGEIILRTTSIKKTKNSKELF